MTNPLTLPRINSKSVQLFCQGTGAIREPVLVKIIPRQRAESGYCFHNVRSQVEEFGGRMILGWSLFEWPRIFIEAEHHAVWEPEEGMPLIDVTPSSNALTHTLFIEDEHATYDFSNEGIRRRNLRVALNEDPIITKLFAVWELEEDFMERLPGVGVIESEIPQEVLDKLTQLERIISNSLTELSFKYPDKH